MNGTHEKYLGVPFLVLQSETPGEATRTIAFTVDSLPETTVVVRTPLRDAREGAAKNKADTPGSDVARTRMAPRKVPVACEPMVSTLTEVARLLQPGRCVT